jgi:uncharacterized phage protein (TIGR02218 family)
MKQPLTSPLGQFIGASYNASGYNASARTGLLGNPDATCIAADCFTLALLSNPSVGYSSFGNSAFGQSATSSAYTCLRFTSADQNITYNGNTFIANSLLVDGLKYKGTRGLDVDKQTVSISARQTDMIGGIPFMAAIRNGVLDGAQIKRERAFFSGWPSAGGTFQGSVILFQGRVADIHQVGRTSAEISVESDLAFLDIKMPRQIYQASCSHVFGDSGCGVNRAAYAYSSTVGAGPSATFIPWTPPSGTIPVAQFTQGSVTFTSGANTGAVKTITAATASGMTLAYPLQNPPSAGDTFLAYPGCDHSLTTCGLYDLATSTGASPMSPLTGNQPNFRGFPWIPQGMTAFVV